MFPRFERTMDCCCQVLVSKLETLDAITFTQLFLNKCSPLTEIGVIPQAMIVKARSSWLFNGMDKMGTAKGPF